MAKIEEHDDHTQGQNGGKENAPGQNKESFKYSIDGNPKESGNKLITGAQIRQEGGISPDYSIFLKINGPGDDELIEDNDQVDLSMPGREQFYSSKRNTNNG